jgi:hypothetical protein
MDEISKLQAEILSYRVAFDRVQVENLRLRNQVRAWVDGTTRPKRRCSEARAEIDGMAMALGDALSAIEDDSAYDLLCTGQSVVAVATGAEIDLLVKHLQAWRAERRLFSAGGMHCDHTLVCADPGCAAAGHEHESASDGEGWSCGHDCPCVPACHGFQPNTCGKTVEESAAEVRER